MAYSDLDDIKKRLSAENIAQLTDDPSETNGTVINTGRVTEAISLADALIDSYLRGKHVTPLTLVPIPSIVRDWSVTLALVNLYKRRINLQIPETLETGAKEARSQLKDVRNNKLMIDDPSSTANTAGYYKRAGGSKKIFTQNSSETGRLDRYFSSKRMSRGTH